MRPLGWPRVQSVLLRRGDLDTQRTTRGAGSQKDGHVRTWRQQPSASPGEKPQSKLNLPTSWSWTPSLQKCEKKKFPLFNRPRSGPVCDIPLWQPEETNLPSIQGPQKSENSSKCWRGQPTLDQWQTGDWGNSEVRSAYNVPKTVVPGTVELQ